MSWNSSRYIVFKCLVSLILLNKNQCKYSWIYSRKFDKMQKVISESDWLKIKNIICCIACAIFNVTINFLMYAKTIGFGHIGPCSAAYTMRQSDATASRQAEEVNSDLALHWWWPTVLRSQQHVRSGQRWLFRTTPRFVILVLSFVVFILYKFILWMSVLFVFKNFKQCVLDHLRICFWLWHIVGWGLAFAKKCWPYRSTHTVSTCSLILYFYSL